MLLAVGEAQAAWRIVLGRVNGAVIAAAGLAGGNWRLWGLDRVR